MVDDSGPDRQPSDDDLIVLATAGGREAFAAIYERHHRAIYRFARTMTGSTALAEDITQEVFLELMRDLDRYDSGRGSVVTYLYAIARNVSRYRLRRERRFVRLDATPVEPRTADDPVGGIARSQANARVRAFIRALSTRYREVLVLCDVQGLSYEEASLALQTPIGTVRSRLHRARRQLADRIQHAERPMVPIAEGARKCPV